MPDYMYRYCIVSACFVMFVVIDALIHVNWNQHQTSRYLRIYRTSDHTVVHWGLLIILWSSLSTSGSGELNSLHFVSNHSALGNSAGTRAVWLARPSHPNTSCTEGKRRSSGSNDQFIPTYPLSNLHLLCMMCMVQQDGANCTSGEIKNYEQFCSCCSCQSPVEQKLDCQAVRMQSCHARQCKRVSCLLSSLLRPSLRPDALSSQKRPAMAGQLQPTETPPQPMIACKLGVTICCNPIG